MEIYGHLYLNTFFKKLFQLAESGIIYKGMEYSWDNIQKVDKSFGSSFLNIIMYSRGYPGATIYFNNGNKMRINGRIFTKSNESLRFDISGFITAESKTFSDFISLIEKKIKTSNS